MRNDLHKKAKRISKGHYQYKNYYAIKREEGCSLWKITDMNSNLVKDYVCSLMACVAIINEDLD